MSKLPAVYIMSNQMRGTLYVGVTSNLPVRVWQHKNHMVDGFTKKYELGSLVWFEVHPHMVSAIQREKQLKRWKRVWKIRLIEEHNREWRDLGEDLASL